MYLDRSYKPRRRRDRGWIWWVLILGGFVVYLYLQQPEWLVAQPLQPTSVPTRSALSWQADAEIHLAAGRMQEAVAAYEEMARLEPDNPDPLVVLARLSLRDRKLTQARSFAARAVEVDPEDVGALTIYARTLDWFGEYETAINYAFDALDLDPENADTLAVLGEIYSDVGNWPRAQAYLDESLAIDPDGVLALRNLAVLYELQGDYESAIATFDRAIAAAPNQADLYIEKGRQYQALSEWEQAIESYQKAVDVAETGLTLDSLGWGLYLSGDPLQALRVLRKAVEIEPEYGPALAHLGMAYYSRRNYEEAAPTLERAIEILGPEESRIEFYYSLGLAHIYKKPEECDKAIPWLQQALEISPQSPPALEGMRVCSTQE